MDRAASKGGHPSTSARTPGLSIARASSLDHSPPPSRTWIRRPPRPTGWAGLYGGFFLRRVRDADEEAIGRENSGLGLKSLMTEHELAAQPSALGAEVHHEGHNGFTKDTMGPAGRRLPSGRRKEALIAGKGPRRAATGALPSCPSCLLRGLCDEPVKGDVSTERRTEPLRHGAYPRRATSPLLRNGEETIGQGRPTTASTELVVTGW